VGTLTGGPAGVGRDSGINVSFRILAPWNCQVARSRQTLAHAPVRVERRTMASVRLPWLLTAEAREMRSPSRNWVCHQLWTVRAPCH
jgi:hypothetical protein